MLLFVFQSVVLRELEKVKNVERKFEKVGAGPRTLEKV